MTFPCGISGGFTYGNWVFPDGINPPPGEAINVTLISETVWLQMMFNPNTGTCDEAAAALVALIASAQPGSHLYAFIPVSDGYEIKNFLNEATINAEPVGDFNGGAFADCSVANITQTEFLATANVVWSTIAGNWTETINGYGFNAFPGGMILGENAAWVSVGIGAGANVNLSYDFNTVAPILLFAANPAGYIGCVRPECAIPGGGFKMSMNPLPTGPDFGTRLPAQMRAINPMRDTPLMLANHTAPINRGKTQ